MKSKNRISMFYKFVPYLIILSLLSFSGCGSFGVSSKKKRLQVLELKMEELVQKIDSIENHSKDLDKRVTLTAKDNDMLNSQIRKLSNDLATIDANDDESDEDASKMKKAVISTQKAIKKLYNKILNLEEAQSNNSGTNLNVSEPANSQNNESYTNESTAYNRTGFNSSEKKKIVLDYDGTQNANNTLQINLNKAKTLTDSNNTSEAIRVYEDILIANPDQLDAHYALGNLYYDQGLVDKSINIYENLVRLNPGDAESHSLLGVVYAKQNMLDEAISELEKAIVINPNLVEVHVGLSVAYLKKGLIDKAITANKSAISINPDFAKAHKYLGMAYKKKGMDELARSSFIKYKELTQSGE